MRSDSYYVGKRMQRLELPGKGPKGGPKRRFMDAFKENMRVARRMQRIRLKGGR